MYSKDHHTHEKKTSRELSDMIATILDSAFAIPGTSIRVGLDPLLGLIPGIGDYLSSLIGSSLLFLASRAGVPRIVIFRMATNIFVNMVVGAIPGIGDIFSFWFKSNVRNAQLLHRHSSLTPPATTATDWVYVIALVTGMFITLGVILIGLIWVITQIWQLFT